MSNSIFGETKISKGTSNFATITDKNQGFGRNLLTKFDSIENQKFQTFDISPMSKFKNEVNQKRNTKNRPPSCSMKKDVNLDMKVNKQ